MEKKVVSYKVFREAMDQANECIRIVSNSLFGEDHWKGYAWIENAPDWGTGLVKMQVNWSCMGEVEPSKALAMATLLQEAAGAAARFIYNGYTIVYGEV